MQLNIITPEKILIEAPIQMVVVPGTEGDFGVLPGHAPFISTIRAGVIAIDMENGEKRLVSIVGGIAEVVPERCTILAEVAEDCSGISLAQAQARVDEAKATLDKAQTESERAAGDLKLTAAQAVLDAVR